METPLSPVGTKYNTETLRKDTITTDDGKVYVVDDLSDISGPEQGEVEEGTIEVDYVYKLAGDVVVNYLDDNRRELLMQRNYLLIQLFKRLK